MTPHPSRRALLLGAAGSVAAGAASSALGTHSPDPTRPAGGPSPSVGRPDPRNIRMPSYRPAYHLSVPDNWKNDPQRPVYLDGEYLYYYLYNADYTDGGPGTAWRLTTTRDHVSFKDHGVAIPKFSNGNGDCWSGCVVVDHDGTAGYGRGALVALVTQAPEGRQAQYLWYSTDRGRTFQPGGTDPVLPNPGVHDFRDPKVIWDRARSRWLMANAEGRRIGFYASADLHHWTEVGQFRREDIGLLECPDIFTMQAGDGTTRWVLGVSGNGKHRGLPATYAYWTGAFDGAVFMPDQDEPQWLDHGFDFYGAVTYPHHRGDGTEDPTLRRAIGWANFWDYPHNTPTMATDGYNGDDMMVRDLRLERDGDGTYYLASQPTAALRDYTRRTYALGDVRLEGTRDLDVRATAYELTCELVWDPADRPGNIGFELLRAPGGGRHVAVGAFLDGGFAFLNRRPTFNPTGGESQTPVDPNGGRLRVRVLVDRTSVEYFVGDGRVVHSHRVFPLGSDDGIRLFSHDGPATFENLTIHELAV
jgi:levanbiose-producing levanase